MQTVRHGQEPSPLVCLLLSFWSHRGLLAHMAFVSREAAVGPRSATTTPTWLINNRFHHTSASGRSQRSSDHVVTLGRVSPVFRLRRERPTPHRLAVSLAPKNADEAVPTVGHGIVNEGLLPHVQLRGELHFMRKSAIQTKEYAVECSTVCLFENLWWILPTLLLERREPSAGCFQSEDC